MELPRLTALCLAALLAVPAARSRAEEGPLPAFPGAEGFGAVTPGGRGGRVIKVTSLGRSGPGSLQAACDASGPRIVVFEVSGVIKGDVRINQPFITIAGQTAPGGGVTINGMLSTAYRRSNAVHDVVVRFLRVRTVGGRGAAGDAIQFSIVDKAVLDHVSCSWAEDETIDIFSKATNVSIQWCSVEESAVVGHEEGRHNYGMIAGRNSKRLSIHHNLFAHHARRIPAIGGGPVDFRNNVAYNFRDGMSHEGNYSGTPGINIIGNYYKRGPSDPKIFPFCFLGKVPYYLRDNFIVGVGMVQDPWAEAGKLQGLRYYARRGTKQEEETPVAKVKTHPPEEAYKLVLARAGCFPRDAVTARILKETAAGTGKWGKQAPADLMEGLKSGAEAPPYPDRDSDGMPDAWEKAHGLSPSDGSDHKKAVPTRYTAIESYCNQMAAWRIAGSPEERCPAKGSLEFSHLKPEVAGKPTGLPGGGARPAAVTAADAEPKVNPKAAKLYRSARNAERQGMKDLAKLLYERLVKEHPDDPLAEKARKTLGRLD